VRARAIHDATVHDNPPEMTMIDMLAFAVVAIALAAPGLIHLIWDIEQPSGERA